MSPKNLEPKNLFQRLETSEADDADEILKLSGAALDEFIRKNGGDPEGIRARGEALHRELMAKLDAKTAPDRAAPVRPKK